MLVAASGWWIGSIIFFIIWVAIAFWPARVAARKGHSFILYFLFSLVFFPAALIVAYLVRRSTPLTAFTTTRTTDCRLACTSDPGPATATASGGRGVGGGETPLARVERPGQL